MFIVQLFRWIFGYADFYIKCRFPERYLNLSFKNGLHIWNIKGEKEALYGCIKSKEINDAINLAQKAGIELGITNEHGLPFLCRKYRKRAGLFAGLIFGVALSCILSGFIWNIKINAPDGMNEYEIRNELRQLGFSEGTYYTFDSVVDIRHKLMVMDDRISWMSINIFGTNAVVELSDRFYPSEEDKSNKAGNIISTADGTVTQISVKDGTALVKPGDGIRKGQLLVSGVIEYSDGSTELTDSNGHITAKTSETVKFRLPMNSVKNIISENEVIKRNISIFGITIPLTLCGDPDGENFRTDKKLIVELFGQGLPIIINEERWKGLQQEKVTNSAENAKLILQKRMQLYEFFLRFSNNIKIVNRKISFSADKNEYVLKVIYELEEEIGEKKYILTDGS